MSNVIHIMSDQNKSHSPPPIRASTPVPNDRSLLSTLTNYSLRRHHSAPQQECRWQQVHSSLSSLSHSFHQDLYLIFIVYFFF